MNYIGLDLGTSSIKGVLTDAGGAVLAESSVKVPLMESGDGRIELDPKRHYEDVCRVIRELASASDGKVAGIAMAAASGNTLLVDADGEPLTNIISWMDARAEKKPPECLSSLNPEEVRRIVGWPCVNIFPLGHLAWLKENEPKLYESATGYRMNTDWLIFKLTGKWIMDHSTVTTFHLQNQIIGRYHKPFLDMLDIPEEKLSPLVDSGVLVGTMTQSAVADCGLPEPAVVATGCFDHPAAARGVGVVSPGQLLLSCGTSWVGFLPETDRDRIIDAEMLCDPFLSSEGGPWGAIFSIPQIGRNIDWYVDNIIAPDADEKFAVFDEYAGLAAPGAAGLEIDLTGKPEKIDADPQNVARAVMEGAANLLKERLENFSKQGFVFQKAVMTGGPSKSPIWPDIVAETTGLEIVVGSQFAGAIGAAKLAATVI